MSNSSTLHVKLDPETDACLKKLAMKRSTSKGQLVREALSACYQATLADLPLQQRQALAAYQGGFISIGKLAKVMGMNVLQLRRWLSDHGCAQNNVHGEQDTANA
ncbi:MAG: hypothetical protein ACQESR_19415 [Planctomycetota bacterium]